MGKSKKVYAYYFKAKHDDGEITLKTVATSVKSAKEIICKAELCPPRALTFLKRGGVR